jgi:microcompartment protein CcmL/EutN
MNKRHVIILDISSRPLQAMEKAQAEAEELKIYIQKLLIPMVLEQVHTITHAQIFRTETNNA